MADNLDPLKTAASAEVDGVEVSAKHSPETYQLIDQAKTELKDWHPQWGSKPEKDTRAEEEAHMLREQNDALIKSYVAKLPDEKHRIRGLMHVNVFCQKLKNILGPGRIHINTPPPVPGFDNTKMRGLFIRIRGMDNFTFHEDLNPGWKKICAIQGPYMSEWGQMNRDERGMFKSWKYIGWRGNVGLRLILADAVTKAEFHQEFGEPQGIEVDREYLRLLDEWERNAKRVEMQSLRH